MAFRFRKLYADLVSEDGTVLIVYMTWMRLRGLRRAMAGFELYFPDGSVRVRRGVPRSMSSGTTAIEGPAELTMEHAGGSLSLYYEPLLETWRPASDAPFPGLHWSVLVPRATVTARWTGPAAQPELSGVGYVDRVELTRPTRFLGVRTLEWGRVHPPEGAVVFAGLESRSGTWWRRVVHWADPRGAEPREHDGYHLAARDGGAFDLAFPASMRAGLVLCPRRVLRRGSVLDPGRSPRRLERLALRLVTGPSEETRWLSAAVNHGHPDEKGGTAVHETVRFGR